MALSIFMKSIRMKVVVLFILFGFSCECIPQENKHVIHDPVSTNAMRPVEGFNSQKVIDNLYTDDLICDENDSLTIRFIFIVETDGSLSGYKLIGFNNQIISEKVMIARLEEIVNKIGKWTPATSQGKAISSKWTLPLKINCNKITN